MIQGEHIVDYKVWAVLLVVGVVFSLVAPSFIFGQEGPGPAWVINGTAVYYEDSNVYLSADPHTIVNSGWVEFTLVSKTYSGPIDAVWGFDPSLNITPRTPQRWAQNVAHIVETPTEVETGGSITLTGITSYGPVSWDDYTPDLGNENNTWLYEFVSANGTLIVAFSSFEQHSETSATLFYNDYATEVVESTEYWPDWVPFVNLDVGTVDYSYQGVETWKIAQFDGDIIAGTEYRVRVWLDVPFTGLSQATYKYIWAVKPGTESIAEAVGSGHLYILDPWIESGYTYRKSHTVNNATGAGVNYTIDVLVHSGSGSDSGANVYLGGHSTDFPNDLTFTDGDQVTELSHWCDDLSADPATFSIRVTDDLSSENQNIYIYYGKSGGTSQSDGPGTFALFDDGSFSGWTEQAGNWDSYNVGGDHGYVIRSPSAADNYYYIYKGLAFSLGDSGRLDYDVYMEVGVYGNYFEPQYAVLADDWLGSATVYAGHRFYEPGGPQQQIYYGYSDETYQLNDYVSRSWSDKVWKPMVMTVDTDVGDLELFYDGEKSVDESWDRVGTCELDTIILRVRRVQTYYDNVRVRKFVDPEPSHGAWGSEETESPGAVGYSFGYILGG